MTMGLLGGQDVFTVDSMQAKIQAQLRGLGGGLPESMVRPTWRRAAWSNAQVADPNGWYHCIMPGVGLVSRAPGGARNGGWNSCTAPPRAGTPENPPPFLIQTLQRGLPGV